jgi:hypothetical protein
MGSDERLSTRDIASPGGAETDTDPQTDPRFERDTVATEPPATEAPPVTDTPPATGEAPATEPAAQSGAEAVAPVPAGGREETMDTMDTPAERETRSDTEVSQAPAGPAADQGEAPLLDDSEGFQSRWEEIQVRFVDEPRGAVEDADALVATVMQRLAEGFAQERERLEAQWGRGEDISTEDLRVALQRYRSFFRRLLAT